MEEEERLIYPRAKASQSSQDLDAMRREMAERRDGLLNPDDEQGP
jgi:hypothetical protein